VIGGVAHRTIRGEDGVDVSCCEARAKDQHHRRTTEDMNLTDDSLSLQSLCYE